MAIDEDVETKPSEPEGKPRFLKVRVVDSGKEHHPTVKITIPIGVVKFGMKMAQAFSPQMKDAKIDWDVVSEAVKEGAIGKLVEVEDEVEHRTVEIWIE